MNTAVKNDDFFDNVKPWADPVDPEVLLDELVNTVGRFVFCNDDTKLATALYIVMTWFIEQLDIVPYCVITAPEMRCGKSTLLDLMADLVYRPFLVAGCSNASLFRLIDSCEPTMLIDEVDTFLSGDQERIGMLNSGYKRKGGFVLRCEGDRHKPTRFKTFGAKVLFGIGGVAKTLLDRSIVMELARKPQAVVMEDFYDLEPEAFKPLHRKQPILI